MPRAERRASFDPDGNLSTFKMRKLVPARHHEGTGMQPRHDITQRGPMEHGESYLDYRLDPRDIDLLLMLTGSVSERAMASVSTST